MGLTLTPATDDWDQPLSAEQSPVEPVHLENARYMSATLLSHMQGFIEAATYHTDSTDSSSKDFIQQWKTTFEHCLNKFGAGYGQSDEEAEQTDAQANVPEANMSAVPGGAH